MPKAGDMSVKFKIKGLDEVKSKLDRLANPKKAKSIARKAARKAMNIVRDAARTNAKSIDDPETVAMIHKNITVQAGKTQSANDNLKWDVDFRTQVDNIQYKHADGSKSENDALLTNRLWLGAKYKADDNSSFFGKLSYNKAFGDTADHSQSNTNPGYANFDWVTNENATDNTIKLKEAYWLYTKERLFGADIPWSASVGRRPSTDGLPINIRNDQAANSPLSVSVHV